MTNDIDNPVSTGEADKPGDGVIGTIIRFCLENKLVVVLIVLMVLAWGVMVAPFDWEISWLPRSPVPVDAIPDIGENQQIVFTKWTGRSPQDVEDQITYPLTVALLGVPGVKTIRSYSYFGFSTIYVIFNEDVEFYWSRTRVLEKLNSLPAGTLPEGVQPALGPDATPLGQIFWYTLEGRDPDGKPVGGWDLNELRTIQDWYVRYYLLSAEGISEVASVGGFVQEYQIDVDPDAMHAARLGINDIFMAVKKSNIDVGARSIEINKAEYFIRGLGFLKNIKDLEYTVVAEKDNVPIYIKDVAKVTLGPALRRGALDKGGAEAVGGVVVVRYGFNPLAAIKNVKKKINEFAAGLPTKAVVDFERVTRDEVTDYAKHHGFDASDGVKLNHRAWVQHLRSLPRRQWPDWVTTSQVTVVPFYDRTGLIYETLGTLNTALVEEILITVIVILVMVMHLRSSILISSLLPLAVFMCFIAMKIFQVDANIVALSGIAIAIGTMVDMGIILCENILKHLDEADPSESRLEVVLRASKEVGSAVLTAVATTVISFLPVFTMTGPEGKLFKPLAFTKTFALIASVVVALTIIPPAAHVLFTTRIRTAWLKRLLFVGLMASGLVIGIWLAWWAGAILIASAAYKLAEDYLPPRLHFGALISTAAAVLLVGIFLTDHWLPLGPRAGFIRNFAFVGLLIGGLLATFQVFERFLYAPILRWCLDHKLAFLSIPACILLLGMGVWLGPQTILGPIPQEYQSQNLEPDALAKLSWFDRFKYELAGLQKRPWYGDIAAQSLLTRLKWTIAKSWEGIGKEFMPPLDEGSFLYMPTTMPHASIGEALAVLQLQDQRIMAIPEVDLAVGKIGRVDSPLDPAPVSMIETIVNYKSEYIVDHDGRRLKFRYDPEGTDWFRDRDGVPLPAKDGRPYKVSGRFIRDQNNRLIPDETGIPFRQWRLPLDVKLNPGRQPWAGITNADDIWKEITEAAQVPGTTSAPRLQPIAARIVMLQSGMRAPMGVKIKGPDLNTIEKVALEIESYLKQIPSVEASAVIADRIVGKPYLEIHFDRQKLARYGLTIRDVQDVVEVAVGGRTITTTVEGRERFPVRVRYLRELRNEIETLGKVLLPAKGGAKVAAHVPLNQVADIKYVRGPQVIKSEDTFLLGYVLFDMKPGEAEVNVVEAAQRFLQRKIDSGEFVLPAGVSYTFAGNYENQIRSQKTLMVVLPLALFLIFIILYFQFRSVITALLVFSGIAIAWAGGFLLLWLYGQPWFLNFSLFGTNAQELFQIHPINLSVAIWVGFLALFGIASDDGVVIATYLDQSFYRLRISNSTEAREATLAAGLRRVRPCLMTTATTILALIPVLTSTGRGSDIMVPMAIPSFGGMVIEIMTMLVVPVLYCAVQEWKIKLGVDDPRFAEHL
ncbi:MAG: cation transporter [Gemmatales bacterium]|nr:MAG: cation transporter [Gemmatales bacterium]